jgi:N6-L-threonylcarbamoyladenine synthase
MKNIPYILAIDTSCDDTSVAVTQGVKVLSNIIASQTEIHKEYGGVMPLMAKLAHHELINPTYKLALKRSNLNPKDINAVAVTYGPGLAIALEVGIDFAKNLAKELSIPMIPINHMKGHLYSSLAQNKNSSPIPKISSSYFPALALLISGGHTDLIILKDINNIEKIGSTIDDAAGECLDKFARLLDLGYPGAAALEQIAKNGNKNRFKFPLPMTQSQDLNYSFSGLKTSGRHQLEKIPNPSKEDIQDLAASFQSAVFDAVIYKLKKAIETYNPKSIWLGGGVSNNLELRKRVRQICNKYRLNFLYPKNKKLSSDNAAMIGITAYFEYLKNNQFINNNSFEREPRATI